MKSKLLAVSAGAVMSAALAACSVGGGREIQIVATDDGCTPTTITATTSEKLTFVMKNDAGTDRELEGIEGTKVEEVLVPAGRTRKVNYTTPGQASTEKVKCYIPGGPSTIINLEVSEP
jgi:hypothetical protein